MRAHEECRFREEEQEEEEDYWSSRRYSSLISFTRLYTSLIAVTDCIFMSQSRFEITLFESLFPQKSVHIRRFFCQFLDGSNDQYLLFKLPHLSRTFLS